MNARSFRITILPRRIRSPFATERLNNARLKNNSKITVHEIARQYLVRLIEQTHYATLVDFEITSRVCRSIEQDLIYDVGRRLSGIKSYWTSFDIPDDVRMRGRFFAT